MPVALTRHVYFLYFLGTDLALMGVGVGVGVVVRPRWGWAASGLLSHSRNSPQRQDYESGFAETDCGCTAAGKPFH